MPVVAAAVAKRRAAATTLLGSHNQIDLSFRSPDRMNKVLILSGNSRGMLSVVVYIYARAEQMQKKLVIALTIGGFAFTNQVWFQVVVPMLCYTHLDEVCDYHCQQLIKRWETFPLPGRISARIANH